MSAFAAATFRRPPTRTIESLMTTSQDPGNTNGGAESSDDESLDLNLSDDESDDNGDMLLNLAVSAGVTLYRLFTSFQESLIMTFNRQLPSLSSDCTFMKMIKKFYDGSVWHMKNAKMLKNYGAGYFCNV